jgi:hypothetical protein
MVVQKPFEPIIGRILFPDIATIADRTSEELKKMRVSKIGGRPNFLVTIQMTLSDGSSF